MTPKHSATDLGRRFPVQESGKPGDSWCTRGRHIHEDPQCHLLMPPLGMSAQVEEGRLVGGRCPHTAGHKPVLGPAPAPLFPPQGSPEREVTPMACSLRQNPQPAPGGGFGTTCGWWEGGRGPLGTRTSWTLGIRPWRTGKGGGLMPSPPHPHSLQLQDPECWPGLALYPTDVGSKKRKKVESHCSKLSQPQTYVDKV